MFSSGGIMLKFVNSIGTEIAAIRQKTAGGNNEYVARAFGDTTVSGVGSQTLTINTTYYIDVRVQVGANITIDFYINGSLISTATAANTAAKTAATTINIFENCHASNGASYFTEGCITDESTLNWRLSNLVSSSAGTHTDMIGNPATSFADGDSNTGVLSTAAGQRESWNSTTYLGPSSPSGIRGVFLRAKIAQPPVVAPTKLSQYLRIGGTNYDGSDITMNAINQEIIRELATNPATAAAWTTAGFSSLEVGLKSAA
jgi:hypothetical protein